MFVVGHDWGAIVSWNLCLLRPDRVRALVNLSVAFTPRNPSVKPLDYFRRAYGDDYYVCRFQVRRNLLPSYTSMGYGRPCRRLMSNTGTRSVRPCCKCVCVPLQVSRMFKSDHNSENLSEISVAGMCGDFVSPFLMG